MRLYRICPHGATKWKVQWLNMVLWRNVLQWRHEFLNVIREFDTETEAEQWIDSRLRGDKEREKERLDIKARKRAYPPRRYP